MTARLATMRHRRLGAVPGAAVEPRPAGRDARPGRRAPGPPPAAARPAAAATRPPTCDPVDDGVDAELVDERLAHDVGVVAGAEGRA